MRTEVELLRRAAFVMCSDVDFRWAAVADWLVTCAGIWDGDAQHAVKVATTHGALEVACAYLGEVRDAQDS